MTAKDPERVLGEFVTRRSGNLLSLTVPADAGIPEGKKYVLVMTGNDTLEYRAVHDNPWLDGTYADIDFQAELADTGNYGLEKPVGKERIE